MVISSTSIVTKKGKFLPPTSAAASEKAAGELAAGELRACAGASLLKLSLDAATCTFAGLAPRSAGLFPVVQRLYTESWALRAKGTAAAFADKHSPPHGTAPLAALLASETAGPP